MHELSVAKHIVDIVSEHLEPGEVCRVKRIHVQVGTFSTIVPDLLKSGFEAAVSETSMNRASLIIHPVPLSIQCNNCGYTREIEPVDFACPECGSTDVEILSGTELVISNIEIEEPISHNGTVK